MKTRPTPDIALLTYARAIASDDGDAIAAARETLWTHPGRAAGRVTAWAAERALIQLRRHGRRPVFAASTDTAPTPLERAFLDILACLGEGRREDARHRADFLITPQGRETFLSALEPAAESLRAAA